MVSPGDRLTTWAREAYLSGFAETEADGDLGGCKTSAGNRRLTGVHCKSCYTSDRPAESEGSSSAGYSETIRID